MKLEVGMIGLFQWDDVAGKVLIIGIDESDDSVDLLSVERPYTNEDEGSAEFFSFYCKKSLTIPEATGRFIQLLYKIS